MTETKEEFRKRISKMKLKQLKNLAKERDVDASKCRTKKDYISTILNDFEEVEEEAITPSEEQLEIKEQEEVFEKAESEELAAKGEQEGLGDLEGQEEQFEQLGGEEQLEPEEQYMEDKLSEHDVHNVSEEKEEQAGQQEQDEEPEEQEDEKMTEEEIARLNETLNLIKDESVEFGGIVNTLSQIEATFNDGKHEKVLEHVNNAMSSGEESLKKLQSIGLSLAILSSQKFIDSIKDTDIGSEEAEKLLFQAKKHFVNEMYDDAAKTVWKIRDIAPKLHEDLKERLSEMIKVVESHIEDSKRIGSDVKGAERMIKEAKALLQNDLLIGASDAVRKAQYLIGEAGEERITVIKEAIAFVEKIIEDAKGIGVDVEISLKHLAKAKELFDKNELQMCMYTTIQAEELTTEAIQRQVKKALALQKSLEDRYRAVTTSTQYQQSGSEEPQKEQESEQWTTEKEYPCPSCGKPLDYVEQYKRWYCYNCQKYA